MVYQNKFVAAVKVNGKVLRESKDSVILPFGSEYSLLLKNLNSVRVKVNVSIDGTSTSDGTWFIIEPNSDLELERFLRNGNFEKGNRFKFIERTEDIEKHKGVGAEDGLIRIEYKTEKVTPVQVVNVPVVRYYDQWVPIDRPYWTSPYRYSSYPVTYTTISGGMIGGMTGCINNAGSAQGSTHQMAMNCSLTKSDDEVERGWEPSESGITVPGSQSDQKFVHGSWFQTEEHSDVVVIKLRGKLAGKTASKPITVEYKPSCNTCGKTSKAGSQFCSNCGTCLNIF